MTTAQTNTAEQRPRADRRRDDKATQKQIDYTESRFVDRAVSRPFVARVQHPPFTADELMQRAVAWRDYQRFLDTMKAPKRPNGRLPQRLRNQLALVKGHINNAKGLHANGKKMSEHYLHSSRRQEAAPLALAA